jgi:hypothetical protein
MLTANRAALLVVLTVLTALTTEAQIDPEKRRLIQAGYNQPLQGRAPIAAYGFYYYNQPQFHATNLTLRLAVAPIYLDAELGFSRLLSPRTDLAVGVAGGGFADSYSEIRRGLYVREESFLGHGAELSSSVYHLFNPEQLIPLHLIVRGSVHQALFRTDRHTADAFELPGDLTTLRFRSGLRLGGQEPSLTEPWAMEVSVWHEARIRSESVEYGFLNDRRIEPVSHLFWMRTLWKYGVGRTEHLFEAGMTAGTTLAADRLSSFRLGGNLPFTSEFPLNIPGYFYQEISAERALLLNLFYSFPLPPFKSMRLDFQGAIAVVDYLPGLEQRGNWHSGVGGGLSYISPAGTWLVRALYGHGFNAYRGQSRGADQIALLFQYDFEAKGRGKSRFFIPGMDPYRSRGAERIFQ